MEQYRNYRDSGFVWLGDIPSHWEMRKVKHYYTFYTGWTPPSGKNEYYEGENLWANISDLKGKYISETTNYISDEAVQNSKLKKSSKGSLFFSFKLSIGTVAFCAEEMYTNEAIATFTDTEDKLKFLYYSAPVYIVNNAKTNIYGAPLLNQDLINNAYIVFPPKEEQAAIVEYLDRITLEIDKFILQLEQQQESMEKYKRELIANAVTKGVKKNTPMKDSGVDWMGDVPQHWNVTKMKWMFEIVKRIYGAEDRDVLSITQHGIKIKDIDSNDGQLAESYANYQVVNVNDFAMNSMDLLTGWVDCSPYEGVTSPDYRVFRFHQDKPQCHSYYKYLFQMCYTNRIFYRLGQGVSNLGRWRLQADQFLNIRLPQPPVEEQEQIAAYLDTKVGQIEELTVDIKAQIEKLKEYRKIVIHDAVTGKIKVTEGE